MRWTTPTKDGFGAGKYYALFETTPNPALPIRKRGRETGSPLHSGGFMVVLWGARLRLQRHTHQTKTQPIASIVGGIASTIAGVGIAYLIEPRATAHYPSILIIEGQALPVLMLGECPLQLVARHI